MLKMRRVNFLSLPLQNQNFNIYSNMSKPLLTTLASLFLTAGFASGASNFTIDGIIYTPQGTQAKVYDGAGAPANVVIPETVTFEGNTYTVTSVGNQAFYAVTRVSSVKLPNTVRSLGENCFNNCSQLGKIEFGNGLQTIGQGAFANTQINGVKLPGSLRSIGKNAFKGRRTTSFTCLAVVPPSGQLATATDDYTFYDFAGTYVHVPAAVFEAYKNSTYFWSRVGHLTADPATENSVQVTYTGDNAISLTPDAVLPVLISNTGTNQVTSIEYTVSIDGQKGEYSLDDIAIPTFTNVPYEFPASLLPAGNHTIVVNVTKVNGVDNTAASQEFTLYLEVSQSGDTPSSVEDIVNHESGEALYYDLMGRRIAQPEHGIYVKVQNGHATKVVF